MKAGTKKVRHNNKVSFDDFWAVWLMIYFLKIYELTFVDTIEHDSYNEIAYAERVARREGFRMTYRVMGGEVRIKRNNKVS